MRVYKIQSHTTVSIVENNKWSTCRLTQTLILNENNLQRIEESVMVFFTKNKYYYVPCVDVIKV